MSGGSLDYLYSDVQEAAGRIRRSGDFPPDLRDAFADHLDLVAEALKDAEWTMSGDYGTDAGAQSLLDFFDAVDRQDAPLHAAIDNAREARKDLARALARAQAANRGDPDA